MGISRAVMGLGQNMTLRYIMRKIMFVLGLLVVIALLLTPILAFADPVLDGPQPLNDDIRGFVKLMFHAVREGNWGTVAAAFIVVLVSFLKKYGAKAHELIPDGWWVDRAFWFLLETKPGGWITNFLTTTAAVMSAALLADEQITWALLRPILVVTLSGAAIWGLAKDIIEWNNERNDGRKKANMAAARATPPTTTS